MLVAGAVLVMSRRPDAFTNPQFWAEDGAVFYADAYNFGSISVLKSLQGYLSVLNRLVAVPASALDLTGAALLFNTVGLAVQIAPAALFVSRRFEHVVRAQWVRAAIGLAYLLLPSFEVNVNITNAQWHLAILAAMTIVAPPPARLRTRVFDIVVTALAGLTGPFAVVLLPAAIASAIRRRARQRWYVAVSGLLLVCLAIQGTAYRLGHRTPASALGVSFRNFVTIISDRIVLPGSLAEEGHTHAFASGSAHPLVFAALISAFACAVIAVAVVRGPVELRIIVAVLFGVTALSLLAPIGAPVGVPAWSSLATSDGGQRYFLTAEVAWLLCLAWTVSRLPRRALRVLAVGVIGAAFSSGLILSWEYPAYIDFHPNRYEAHLTASAPGTKVVVPINPSWQMILIRH